MPEISKKQRANSILWLRNYQTDIDGESVMHWVTTDEQGGRHNVLAARKLVHHPAELRGVLTDALAALPHDPRQALEEVTAAIQRGPSNSVIGVLTRKSGWHRGDHQAFVLPADTVGDKNVVHLLRLNNVVAKSSHGTLDEWRKGLKKPCASSPYLVFALSLAFASPTLRSYSAGTGLVFNFAGETGTGKTMVLRAMQSTLDRANNTDIPSTDITNAGLETHSYERNDLFFCLDEFGAALSTPKVAASLVLKLAYGTREGRGKKRSIQGQKTLGFDHATWIVAVLTSSENTLDNMMGDEKREGGAMMRFVDLPVPKLSAEGAFPTLKRGKGKGSISREDLLQRVAATIDNNYGHALPAFVNALMETTQRAKVDAYFGEFMTTLTNSGSGKQQRYLEAFAKVYAAGRLAAELDIAPFTVERVQSAVLALFEMSIATDRSNSANMLAAVAVLHRLGEDSTRCFPLGKGDTVSNSDGRIIAVRTTRAGVEKLFVHTAAFAILVSEYGLRAVTSYLAEKGILKTRGDLCTTQASVDGLIKGQPRPSGYTLDWQKLAALKLTSKAH